MKELKVTCNTLAELPKAGSALIDFSDKHKVFAFYGKMGAGKTTFIKEICRELGVTQNVTSPTFSLVNEYKSDKGTPVYHFDFYRIKSEAEAMDIGCEEYFYSGHICLVEWPEKVLNLLPKDIVRILIEVAENEQRQITFSYD
jgi:tRNA threonylcarbamoyladenosine biosynthesis protein TsaE